MSTGRDQMTAYRELLTSAEVPGEETLDWFYICNICARRLDEGSCPEHAPRNVPGLEVISCGKQGHGRVWMIASEGYPPNCPGCDYDAMRERINYLERCRHWPYRRWKSFARLTGWAYSLGIITGRCFSIGGGKYAHKGCTHGIRWRGRRPYILGWPDWKWSCLLKKRHWPGTFVGLGACTKCLPCPECGSTTGCFAVCDNVPADRGTE